jgi:hypothetical protein
MHTPSTRILSGLAYDRGEEYDPAEPVCPDLLGALSLVEQARPVIGEDGPYERGPAASAGASRADGDPGVVLGRGPDHRTVGHARRAVRLTGPRRARAPRYAALGPAARRVAGFPSPATSGPLRAGRRPAR